MLWAFSGLDAPADPFSSSHATPRYMLICTNPATAIGTAVLNEPLTGSSPENLT